MLFDSWMEKAASGAIPAVPASTQVTPDSIATIIYTSGTTGNPKGVELSHRNLTSDVELGNELWRRDGNLKQHTALAYLPWAHVFGMTCDLHQLNATGACSYILTYTLAIAHISSC